jgi:hypothetical protein
MAAEAALPQAVVPGPGDAAGRAPDAQARPESPAFGRTEFGCVALVHMSGVDEGLAGLHQGKVEVGVGDHFSHETAMAVGGVGEETNLGTTAKTSAQVGAAGRAVGWLIQFRGVDAGEPHRDRFISVAHANRVSIPYGKDSGADPFHRRWKRGVGRSDGPGSAG